MMTMLSGMSGFGATTTYPAGDAHAARMSELSDLMRASEATDRYADALKKIQDAKKEFELKLYNAQAYNRNQVLPRAVPVTGVQVEA